MAISGRGPVLSPLHRHKQGTVRLPLRPLHPGHSPPHPGPAQQGRAAPIPTAEASPQLSRAQNTGQQRALGTGPFIICHNYYLPTEGRAAAERPPRGCGLTAARPHRAPLSHRPASASRGYCACAATAGPSPSLPRRSPAVPLRRNVWVEVNVG